MSTAPLRITNLRLAHQGKTSRITADVDGWPVWWESADVSLLARAEVVAAAFLLPAIKSGRVLQIEGVAISPLWLEHAGALMKQYHAWWGYAPVPIACDPAPPVVAQTGHQRTALFFTGGVDSFYSLLCMKEPIDDLVYVHGFDVGLEDVLRAEDTIQHIQTIATEMGHRLIVMRTNLRTHPLLRDMEWSRTHGGALASVAYTLPDVTKMIISASFVNQFVVPWGSHPETDPLWSNEQLTFMHQGVEVDRLTKLLAISENPLVWRHLQVCWKNYGRRNNCCKCEKCVRTMLMLKSLTRLEPFEAFPLRHQLFWRACSISTIPPVTFYAYQSILRVCPQWQIRLAIRIMLMRSWIRHQKRIVLRTLFFPIRTRKQ